MFLCIYCSSIIINIINYTTGVLLRARSTEKKNQIKPNFMIYKYSLVCLLKTKTAKMYVYIVDIFQ